jgi:hypothetical protein
MMRPLLPSRVSDRDLPLSGSLFLANDSPVLARVFARSSLGSK